MPEAYQKHRPYPGTVYRLREAAENGQLIECRCTMCRRMVRYLASDLAELLGRDRDAYDPPFKCSKCNSWDYVMVRLRLPDVGDYGHLEVRRPAGVKKTQMWHTVKLGD